MKKLTQKQRQFLQMKKMLAQIKEKQHLENERKQTEQQSKEPL